MKLWQKTAILLPLVGAWAAHAALFSVSEAQINDYLQHRLQKEAALADRFGVPGWLEIDYQLSDLKAEVGRTAEKKVAVSGVAETTARLKGKVYSARIRLVLDTDPFYDAAQGALYLKNVRLLEWESSDEAHKQELAMILPLLAGGIQNWLDNKPVYVLNDEKMQEAILKKWGKSLSVETGEIRMEASLF